MLRLATVQDIPWIAERMIELKAQTAWKDMPGDYSIDTLTTFLYERLWAPDSVCYVWDDPMDAFCGVTAQRMHLPPYLPSVFEWGWSGEPRHAAACWRACTVWAQRHGAVLACRTKSEPGSTIRETLTWERL